MRTSRPDAQPPSSSSSSSTFLFGHRFRRRRLGVRRARHCNPRRSFSPMPDQPSRALYTHRRVWKRETHLEINKVLAQLPASRGGDVALPFASPREKARRRISSAHFTFKWVREINANPNGYPSTNTLLFQQVAENYPFRFIPILYFFLPMCFQLHKLQWYISHNIHSKFIQFL